MNKVPFFSLLCGIVIGCSQREPRVETFTDTVVMSKHNFRSGEKDGYKVEVWTLGRTLLAGPLTPGLRIYVEKGEKDKSPIVTVDLTLRRNIHPDDVRKASVKPALKKTAIEGGYWENIMIDQKTDLERPEKFTGKEGVWETNLDDPLMTDIRIHKEKGKLPNPGKYSLTIEIAIQNGPTFRFENLPQDFRGSRAPGDKIE